MNLTFANLNIKMCSHFISIKITLFQKCKYYGILIILNSADRFLISLSCPMNVYCAGMSMAS